MINRAERFDFLATNVSILKIKNPTPQGIRTYEQIPTNLGFVHPSYGRVYNGSGIIVNTKKAKAPSPDGYVYIYGIAEGKKSLLAARTKPENFEHFNKWTFWDGTGWVKGVKNIAPITDGISNELSVTPIEDGRYLLTFTVMGISDKIGIKVGSSPVGPFGETIEVYTVQSIAKRDFSLYAKPILTYQTWKLLVRYNTITLISGMIPERCHIYHPRFVWVNYK